MIDQDNEELNPLTLGDMPEEFIENEDGSVDIPDLESVETDDTEFLANLAVTLPKDVLNQMSSDLVDLIEKDKKSREKRDKQYEEGLRRTGLGDDAPGGAEFSGASKVVHPVLAEACVDFSSRAIKELFPASGPVKSWIIGDASAEKTERAARKTKFMNWQLTTQMIEYRDELEQLLTQLPMGGSQYQKFWYDERLKRPRCDFVPVDEIFLPYSATNFYSSPRVTHRQLITRHEFNRRVRNELYRDVFIVDPSTPDTSSSSSANDKIEGREDDGYNEDGVRPLLEIYTWQEFEDDPLTNGEYAPYIITIDEDTEEVLAVYRNWEDGDLAFEKLDWFVEWKFIPWRGAYAIGLPHLIGGISAALTGALRALLDSAHINNAATMLKLGSGRIVGQNTQVNVTEVCSIEGPAGIDDIRKIAMPMPFNQPSPVLASLMQDLYGLAKGVVATAEDKIGQVGDRTPVGTTMALIEQGSNTYSAIHARLHESQKRALKILHRINATYLDEQSALEDLGEMTVRRDDFLSSLDVIPVSDPTIFSEAQRFAQTQGLLQMAQQDAANPNIKWNQVEIRRRALKQMRIEGIDELLPAVPKPVTADPMQEQSAALQGIPVKADIKQDHMAHIQAHLVFVSSPVQVQNPLVPPQALSALLGHLGEHVQMYQHAAVQQVLAQVSAEIQMSGEMMSPDAMMAIAQLKAQQQLIQELGPILKKVTEVQQQLQQRTPQPQMPPEVQASIQIAKMDIDRKAKMDEATLAMKNQENQLTQQAEQAKAQMKQAELSFAQQMEQSDQRFNQYMEQLRLQAEQRDEEYRQQVDIMNNRHDNEQKQMTELLKNRDDNETKILIEQMSQRLSAIQEQSAQPAQNSTPDLNPQLQQMQQYLDQIGKQQTNDALASVMEGLRATIESLNKPKTILRDAKGKAQGITNA